MSFKEIIKWIDPYKYIDILLYKLFGEPDNLKTKTIYWIVYILFSFIFAFIIYKISGVILGVKMPFAIVVSSSMEPTFSRGDIMILGKPIELNAEIVDFNENIAEKDLEEFTNMKFKINEYGLKQIESIEIGNKNIDINSIKKNNNSVIVYNSNINNKDIIHRIVVYIKAKDGNFIITKGDNNKTNRIIDEDCNIDRSTGLPRNACLNIYPINVNKLKGKKIGIIPYLGYVKLFIFG